MGWAFQKAAAAGDTPKIGRYVNGRMDERVGRDEFGGRRLHSRTAFKAVIGFGTPRRIQEWEGKAREGTAWGNNSSLIPPKPSGTSYDSTLLLTLTEIEEWSNMNLYKLIVSSCARRLKRQQLTSAGITGRLNEH